MNKNKEIHIITRSAEQITYMDIEISILEYVEELEMNKTSCVVFDDMLDTSQKLIDPFFTRGRHHGRNVYYLSQSYFDNRSAPYDSYVIISDSYVITVT